MNLPVVFRRLAAEEFLEAREWYGNKRPGLGAECVDEPIASISEAPTLHAKVHGDIRRILVHRFPYGVFYVVDAQTIIVLAVFHCSRDPSVWRAR